MAYTRTNWVESVTPLSAANMNNIEDGIEQALAFGREEAIDLLYPLGSIYLTTNRQNPSVTFGRGTWVAWGTGRVPIGVDSDDTDFNSAEKTGGAKTHTHTNPTTGSTALTVDQIPSHTHSMGGSTGAGSGAKPVPSGSSGNIYNTGATGGGQGHTHTMGSTGEASSLQPYITCYMWKRIG